MRRYIDADEALRMMRNSQQDNPCEASRKGIWHTAHESCISCVEATPTADVLEIPEGGIGNLSDGYHTFNELYHHRAILFSVICNSMPDKTWKSKLHDTGDMFDGMFIVGIETPEGQATYHYDIHPYWDMFMVKELEKAPKWDGHTPQVAIERISRLSADLEAVRSRADETIDALHSEVRELTSENEAWQQRLISEEEKSGKAYYDLACEVEDLRAENERLHETCTEFERKCASLNDENERLKTENDELCDDIFCLERESELVVVNIVRKMQNQLKMEFDRFGINDGFVTTETIDWFIDRIAKDVLEERN